jgi:hypothetical protein
MAMAGSFTENGWNGVVRQIQCFFAFRCRQGAWLTLVEIPENTFGSHERILKELEID